MDNLDKKYKSWEESQTFECMEKNELKELLTQELKYLSGMNVQEYTLYRKYQEIQGRYSSVDTRSANTFWSPDSTHTHIPADITEIKNKIWRPKSPEDYQKLEPVLLWTMEHKDMAKVWTVLRTFTCTLLNNPNIGRSLRFVVMDNITGKYLGVICISSDFMDLTPRDNYIGWSREIKTTKKMINHTAIGSSIVPTQPLGFNYVGGKLLALLTLSDTCENAWNKRYGDKLVAVTTTSLYGSYSQYQNLKYWNKRGHTAGSIKFEPSKDTVLKIRSWLKCNFPRRYWEWYEAKNEKGLPLKRDHKQRSLAFVYKELSIDKSLFQADHQRGIYFSTLFNNSCDFLRMEIDGDKLTRRFDNRVESLVNIWKEKYAKKRLVSLMKNERYTDSSLFYDFLIGESWDNVKEKYMKEVGR